MYDLFYTTAFFAHGALFLAFLFVLCRRLDVPKQEWPFVILLLLWSSFVLGGHGASLLNKLNDVLIYGIATLFGLVFMAGLFSYFWRKQPTRAVINSPALVFPLPESRKVQKVVFWFLAGTLGFFALCSVVLGMSVYPDNADSMIYRLPRAFWYVSHGSFMHPFDTPDNRLIYYPLNGVALYVPLVLYGLPGTWHSLPSLIAWGMVVYATYRFARGFGAPRLWGLFAAWLVGLTPSILAQAVSTNDEIIAAVAFLGCLYMGFRWLVTGRSAYMVLAGLALALSAGTKLHIVFLLPMIGLAVFFFAMKAWRAPGVAKAWFKAIGWETGLTTVGVVVVLFVPFLFYNYASVGRWYFFDDFKADVFNLSANLRIGFQNLLIYLSQMTLSPIADMNVWPVANDRQAFNTRLNQIFAPLIAPLLDQNPSYYHLGYRFVGITLAVSVRFVEFSLWAGFVWLLWPLQGALALRQKTPLRALLFLIAITPPLWLFLWSFSTLYMEGTATYFSFYLICAAPAAVVVFSAISRPILSELRWVLVCLVAFTNVVICHNLVMYSGFRALPDIYYAKTWPYDWLLTEPRIIEEIRAASKLRIIQTHEKMPFFGYMHWNPRAIHISPFALSPEKTMASVEGVLQIFPISGLNVYGFMPIKIPGKLMPGPTYLGAVRAIGREAIFAVGNDVQKRYPEDSNYIILHAVVLQTGDTEWSVGISKEPLGFSSHDQLTFEYEIFSGGRQIYHQKESKNPAINIKLGFNPALNPLVFKTVVRSAWNGKEIARVSYNVGGAGSWLPDGSEY